MNSDDQYRRAEALEIELELRNEALRKAQTEIETLRQRYMDLYLLAPIGYLVIDGDGKILDVNLTASRMFERQRKQLTETVLAQYLTAESLPVLNQLLSDLKDTQQAQSASVTVQREKRGLMHAKAYGQPFIDGNDDLMIRLTLTDITEQVETEIRLRESEARFRRAIVNAPEPVVVHAEDGEVIILSNRWVDTTGYSIEDIPTTRHWTEEAYGNEYRRDVDSDIAQQYQLDDRRDEGDYAIRTKDGRELIWAFSSSSLGTLPDGRRIAMSVARDVTERRRAEAALQRSEAQYRLMVENATDMVARHKPDGEYIYVTPACYRLLGYLPHEMIGRSSYEFFHPDDLEAIRESHRTVTSGEKTDTVVYRIRRKYGDYIWFETTSRAIRDAETGDIRELQTASRDVTQRQEAEADLRRSEQRFRLLFEQSPDGHFLHDLDGQLVDVNQSVLDLFGYTRDEMLTRRIVDTHVSEDRTIGQRALRELIETGSTHFEARLVTKTGKVLYGEVLSSVVTIDGLARGLGVFRDITDRKQAENRVRRAQRFAQATVDSLSATIAIVDGDGTIIGTNKAWDDYAAANGGLPEHVGVGVNYFDALKVRGIPGEIATINNVRNGLHEVLTGQRDYFAQEYALTDDVWYVVHMTPFVDGEQAGAVVAHENISLRKRSEQQTKRLNGQLARRNMDLMYVQDTALAFASTLVLDEIYRSLAEGLPIEESTTEAFTVLKRNADNVGVAQYALLDGDVRSVEACPQLSLATGPIAQVVQTANIQFIALPEAMPAVVDQLRLAAATAIPFRAGLYVPLEVGDRVWGVACWESSDPDACANLNHSVIATVAAQAAVAIEKAQLYAEVEAYAITLERRVEVRTEQLGRLNQRMMAILNNASDVILLVGESGNIDVVNPAFNRQFGYTTDELYDKSLTVVVCPTYQTQLLLAFDEALHTGKTVRAQLKCCRKDGSTFDAEMAFALVPNSLNNIVCTVFDITAFKDVERMKDQFISTVNHELRTPLAGIVLSSGMLQSHYEKIDDDKRKRKIDQIVRQAGVMSELIDSILDSSRLESAQVDRMLQPFDMVATVKQVISELSSNAETKHLKLAVSVGAPEIVYTGDPTDFARIWRNLIGNAVKYTPEGGEIDVTVRVERLSLSGEQSDEFGAYIIGEVSDDGPGIPPEDLRDLFTRFYRGWAKGSHIPGTGLGLSLVKELLRQYGGDISVQTMPDEGSTFIFWLPVPQTSAQNANGAAPT